ncbi:PHP domain-containing protein [Jonesia quinghaiensis]|uniref:PHP domain-containing protein n=1 Tax=Jonesia quinghaiensis TaxID=262806 RepID=UPI0004289383|nr:PHP domain-containing protein [Jonesia quinghaiensis]
MRIDLHTHSTVSDGTTSPAQVVAQAAAEGLDVIALTDHDSTLGWEEATSEARAQDIILVPGAEISARCGGISVHVLSYLHDPDNPAMREHERRVQEARRDRARIMVDRLAQDHPITWDDVIEQTKPGTTIGRPHLADALVRAGIVTDRSEAFDTLLWTGSPYYVHHYAPEAVTAVEMICAAGGVAVFAHPGASARGAVVADTVIEDMISAGLHGLEIHHRDNPPHERTRLTGIAQRHGVLVTGSSDFHGDGKPNRLGENTTTLEVFQSIEELGVTPVVRP